MGILREFSQVSEIELKITTKVTRLSSSFASPPGQFCGAFSNTTLNDSGVANENHLQLEFLDAISRMAP
jgi:hypothetical protein